MVFAADEYYLLAGRDLPSAASYDGYPQHENGIGMARAFVEAFARPAAGGPGGVRHGFFASVDAAPAEGYRAPRLPTVPAGADSRPVTILTGTYGARVLGPLLAVPPASGHRRCTPSPTTSSGATSAWRACSPVRTWPARSQDMPDDSRCLLPDACLNEGRFLDGLTLADLPRPVEVVPTEGASLRRALDGTSFRPGVRRMSPMVVVAGRPNVGKSSLVNRIVGARAAVVEEEKGVTRDRKELSAEWSGVPFSIMDTGGWLAAGDALEAKVSDQAERALAEADVILMVVDVTTGVTDEDLAAAKVIRRAGPPVRLVVNKVDGASRESAIWEFVSLGLGDPYPVSSLHGRGTGDLLDEVVALLPVPLPDEDEGRSVHRPGTDSARGDRDPGNAERRHHRPAQRGQVDTLQQAPG